MPVTTNTELEELANKIGARGRAADADSVIQSLSKGFQSGVEATMALFKAKGGPDTAPTPAHDKPSGMVKGDDEEPDADDDTDGGEDAGDGEGDGYEDMNLAVDVTAFITGLDRRMGKLERLLDDNKAMRRELATANARLEKAERRHADLVALLKGVTENNLSIQGEMIKGVLDLRDMISDIPEMPATRAGGSSRRAAARHATGSDGGGSAAPVTIAEERAMAKGERMGVLSMMEIHARKTRGVYSDDPAEQARISAKINEFMGA